MAIFRKSSSLIPVMEFLPVNSSCTSSIDLPLFFRISRTSGGQYVVFTWRASGLRSPTKSMSLTRKKSIISLVRRDRKYSVPPSIGRHVCWLELRWRHTVPLMALLWETQCLEAIGYFVAAARACCTFENLSEMTRSISLPLTNLSIQGE